MLKEFIHNIQSKKLMYDVSRYAGMRYKTIFKSQIQAENIFATPVRTLPEKLEKTFEIGLYWRQEAIEQKREFLHTSQNSSLIYTKLMDDPLNDPLRKTKTQIVEEEIQQQEEMYGEEEPDVVDIQENENLIINNDPNATIITNDNELR